MGSQSALADKIGVTKVSLGEWINGRTKSIRPIYWVNLQPYIAKYLPDDFDLQTVNEAYEPYQVGGDIDPLCQDILNVWDDLDPAAQNEILRIVSKYRKR